MTMAGVTGLGKSGRARGFVCSTSKEAGVAVDDLIRTKLFATAITVASFGVATPKISHC